MLCITCQQPVDNQPYRLIGVEKGIWASQYAHRGACEDEARRLYASAHSPVTVVNTGSAADEPPEELTMDAPDPFPDTDSPWFGMERRRV